PPAQQKQAARGARQAQRERQTLSAIPTLGLPPDSHHHGHGAVRVVLREPRLGRGPPRARQSQPRRGTPSSTAEAASGRLCGRAARSPRGSEPRRLE
ncbi:unnamed protein product, partial [Prorocentrum cordatum]